MLRTLHYALETVQFDPSSKLGSDLQKVIDTIITAVNQQQQEVSGHSDDMPTTMIVPEIYKHENTFKQIYKKHLGITLREIKIGDFGNNTHVRMDLDEDDYDVFARGKGLLEQHPDVVAKKLREATLTQDPDTGKITEALSNRLYCTLYMDPMMFAHHIKHRGLRNVTSEEITAFILHEIGHVVTNARYVGETYFKLQVLEDTMRNIKDKKIKFTADDIRALKTTLDDPKNKELKDQVPKAMIMALDKSVDILSPNKVGVMHRTQVAIGTALGILLALLISKTVLVWWIVRVFSTMLGPKNITMLGRQESVFKTSDTLVTRQNITRNERSADQFVTRQGYGRALYTGLHLLEQSDSPKYQRYNASNKAMVRAFIKVFTLSGDDGADPTFPYDAFADRLHYIIENMSVILKDRDLPEDLRKSVTADIKQLKDLQAKVKQGRGYKSQKTFWSAVYNLMNLRDPATHRLEKDYEDLQRLSGGLLNNPFYYYAEQLRQTANARSGGKTLEQRLKDAGVTSTRLAILTERHPDQMKDMVARIEVLAKQMGNNNQRIDLLDVISNTWYLDDVDSDTEAMVTLDKDLKKIEAVI